MVTIVRDGRGESAEASQIIVNIPLKGRDGSLWAADRSALVVMWREGEGEGRRNSEKEMTSAALLWRTRA